MKSFIDIETGGFSISKNGVCEIGMVITDDNCNVIKEFQHYIKPYSRPDSDELVSYKEDAMAVNGITMDTLWNEGIDVKDAIQMLMNEFKEISATDDFTVIGHNSIAFDIPRITHLIERFYHYEFVWYYPQEDTKAIARRKLNLDSYSLENLCNYFGVINERAHSALSDVYATIEVYKKLKEI